MNSLHSPRLSTAICFHIEQTISSPISGAMRFHLKKFYMVITQHFYHLAVLYLRCISTGSFRWSLHVPISRLRSEVVFNLMVRCSLNSHSFSIGITP
ncbi:hypothetical protein VPHF99_0086 [Vibrio phage F99]